MATTKETPKKLKVTPSSPASDSQSTSTPVSSINPANYKSVEEYIKAVAEARGNHPLKDRQIAALRKTYNEQKASADAAQAARDKAFKANQDKVAQQIAAEKAGTTSSSSTEKSGSILGNVDTKAGTLTPNGNTATGSNYLGTGDVRYIQDMGNGKFSIVDSTGNNVITDQKTAAAKAKSAGIQILPKGVAAPTGYNTGFNNNASSSFPGSTTSYVMLPDKTGKLVQTSVGDAYNYGYSNLGALRKTLLDANQLTKSESNDPTRLLAKWGEILNGASMTQDYKNPFEYANYLKSQGFSSTGTSGGYIPTANIYGPSEASNAIQNAFNSTIRRNADAKEVADWTAKLKKAQEANPSRPVMVNGVLEYQGGINPTQWVADQLMKTPEYLASTKAKATEGLAALETTARANGLDLNTNFGNLLPEWEKALAAGGDIKTYQTIIRNSARNHLPESIRNTIDPSIDLNNFYAPYINSYAKTFGVDPNTVKISDIEPLALDTTKGTLVPIYEFDKAKRNLPGWDKTPEGHQVIADAATKVLQDFGFMG